ncbi:hypothetical protein B0T17DRAFT_474298, partial [Bombardia bombarda]
MKFESLLAAAILATTTSAIGPAVPGGVPAAERPAGKPTKLDSWKWTDPFSSHRIKKFAPACSAEQTFHAAEYLLDDMAEAPPLGLLPYREALKKVFAHREYPGSWDGIDPHGYDRNVLMMGYADVPVKVREWIEEQERSDGAGRGLFAVYDRPTGEGDAVKKTVRVPAEPIAPALRPLDKKKVVIFAPGALYEVLPLWVAETSECQDTLVDLSQYTPKVANGAVVAYPVKKTKANRDAGKREMEFTIKAEVLK